MSASILVVVEDVATAELLAQELAARGLCVAVACNADDAERTAAIACFALAIIDVRRAGFGGLAIASGIRAHSHHRALQMIALVDEAFEAEGGVASIPFASEGMRGIADAAARTAAKRSDAVATTSSPQRAFG